jgi:hypothetical protein
MSHNIVSQALVMSPLVQAELDRIRQSQRKYEDRANLRQVTMQQAGYALVTKNEPLTERRYPDEYGAMLSEQQQSLQTQERRLLTRLYTHSKN